MYQVTHAVLKCADCDFMTTSDKSRPVKYALSDQILEEVKGDACYIKCADHGCKECKIKLDSELLSSEQTACNLCHKTFKQIVKELTLNRLGAAKAHYQIKLATEDSQIMICSACSLAILSDNREKVGLKA